MKLTIEVHAWPSGNETGLCHDAYSVLHAKAEVGIKLEGPCVNTGELKDVARKIVGPLVEVAHGDFFDNLSRVSRRKEHMDSVKSMVAAFEREATEVADSNPSDDQEVRDEQE